MVPSMSFVISGLISAAAGTINITERLMDVQQCLGEALPTARVPRTTVSINQDDV